MNKGTENLQQALETGADYNIIRGAEDVSAFPDIICQDFPEICLSLRLSVSEHSFVLAEGTFHITAP